MIRPANSNGVNRLLYYRITGKNKSGLGRAGKNPTPNAIATQLRLDIAIPSQAVCDVDSRASFIRSVEEDPPRPNRSPAAGNWRCKP